MSNPLQIEDGPHLHMENKTTPKCAWPLSREQFRNFGTPNNFWTKRAISFKFGTEMEDGPRLHRQRGVGVSLSAFLLPSFRYRSTQPGLWLRSSAGWLPRTGISSVTVQLFWVWDYHTLPGLPENRSTGKHVFSLIVAQLGLKLELVLRLVLLSKYDVVHFFINCKYLLLNCITDYYVLFCKD